MRHPKSMAAGEVRAVLTMLATERHVSVQQQIMCRLCPHCGLTFGRASSRACGADDPQSYTRGPLRALVWPVPTWTTPRSPDGDTREGVGFVAKPPATHQRQSAAKLLNHKDKFP